MTPRTYYRFVVLAMGLLMAIGSIEYRLWLPGLMIAAFGYAVWRAELPTWDSLWEKGKKPIPSTEEEA